MDMLLKPRAARRSLVMRLAGGAPGVAPIFGGRLFPPPSLARAQIAGVESTAIGADGATWERYAADQPRFNGVDRRLVIGGQRTNLNAGARTWANMGSGITVTAADGPDNSIGTAYRWDEGTGASTHNGGVSILAYTSGTSYALSLLVRPETCTAIQLLFPSATFGLNAWANFDLTGNGAAGTVGAAVTRTAIRRVGNWYWCEIVAPATATASAQALIYMASGPTMARAGSYTGTSRTLVMSWAQVEEGAFASMFVLPPVAAPAAATRGADLITAPDALLGIGSNAACTILGTTAVPAFPSFSTLAQLDDGTNNNRYVVSLFNGQFLLTRTLAGAGANATSSNATAGTLFRWGMAIDGGGRAAASIDGATAVSVTGGPTSGIGVLRIGDNAAGTAPMFGEVGALRVLPFALSDADLAARVATFTG